MGQKKNLRPPRVVLDTNCVLSALLFSGGRVAWLRRDWQRRRFIPLLSRDTATELLAVLKYPKFKLDSVEQQALLAEFLPYAETVRVGSNTPNLPELSDPDDVKFLALAIEGKADALISGDDDILAARRRLKSIPIMTVAEFADWLNDRAFARK